MKLKSIVLEHYGIYARRQFDFDAAPFVLIYGGNESGKTTALNGIRQALFGFPVRTPYRISGQMQASVTASLDDARQLEFVRRKGRSNQLQSSIDGVEIQEADVSACFGNLSLEHYQAIFGISLQELQQGEEALKSTPLFSALTGSGTTGISLLQKLQNLFAESTNQLYRSRGSNYPINELLAKIADRREKANSSAVVPSAIASLRTQISETQTEAARLKSEYETAFRRKTELEAQLRVLPQVRAMRQARQQLKQTDVPDGVDRVAVANWQEYSKQRRGLSERLGELEQKQILSRKQLDALPGDSGTSKHAEAIERLGHQAADVEFKRKQLEDAVDGAEKSRAVLAGLAKEFQCDLANLLDQTIPLPALSPRQRTSWTDQANQLAELHAEADRQRELQRAAQQSLREVWQSFSDQLQRAGGRNDAVDLEALESRDEADDNRYDELIDDVCPANDQIEHLKTLLQACVDAKTAVDKCESDLVTRRSEPTFAELQRKLQAFLGPTEVLSPHYQIPDVQWFKQRLASEEELYRKSASFRDSAERLEKDIAEIESTEQSAADAGGAELLERIEELRERRENLLQNWVDDLSQPLIASTLDAEEQTQRLGELRTLLCSIDEGYSELLQSAETLAKIQHQQSVLAEKQSELSALVDTIADLQTGMRQIQAEIADNLRSVPLKPAASKELVEWVESYGRWSTARLRVDEVTRSLLQAQNVLRTRRDEVIDQWPEVLREEFSVEQCLSTVETWHRIRESHEQLRQRSNKHSRMQRDCEQRLKDIKKSAAGLSAQFDQWRAEQAIGGDWTLADFKDFAETLDRAAHELEAYKKSTRQAETLREQIESFESNVAAIRELLCNGSDANPEEWSATPPEQLASSWLKSIQRDRTSADQRLRIAAELEHTERTIAELKTTITGLDAKLAEIATAVGSAGSVDSVMQSIVKAEELRAKISECQAAIDASGLKIEELDNLDETGAAIELQELGRTLTDLEDRRQTNDQQNGRLAEQLKQLSTSEASAEHLQEIQNARAELADRAQQWLVQRTAVFIANRALALHAKENEPRLLQLSKEYLTKLTRGRYIGVEHQAQASNNRQQSVCVRRADGTSVWPSELSTGTREQLYLALRMAFVQQYADAHEPLPVLMDDCLVNFDDDRMESAIEAFGNWDRRVQTILFSCHARTVDVVRKTLPGAHVIELDKLNEAVGV